MAARRAITALGCGPRRRVPATPTRAARLDRVTPRLVRTAFRNNRWVAAAGAGRYHVLRLAPPLDAEHVFGVLVEEHDVRVGVAGRRALVIDVPAEIRVAELCRCLRAIDIVARPVGGPAPPSPPVEHPEGYGPVPKSFNMRQ